MDGHLILQLVSSRVAAMAAQQIAREEALANCEPSTSAPERSRDKSRKLGKTAPSLQEMSAAHPGRGAQEHTRHSHMGRGRKEVARLPLAMPALAGSLIVFQTFADRRSLGTSHRLPRRMMDLGGEQVGHGTCGTHSFMPPCTMALPRRFLPTDNLSSTGKPRGKGHDQCCTI